eukprot:scaffold285763_cov71-Attheya_sp.AAC.1
MTDRRSRSCSRYVYLYDKDQCWDLSLSDDDRRSLFYHAAAGLGRNESMSTSTRTNANAGMSTVGIGMTDRHSRSVQPTIRLGWNGMEPQFNYSSLSLGASLSVLMFVYAARSCGLLQSEARLG